MSGPVRTRSALLVFVLGAVVGAGTVGLVSSAGNAPPNLVAGNVVGVEYDPAVAASISVSVNVYNASNRAITALPTSIAGWPHAGEKTGVQELPAKSWTELVITALPDCDRVLTNVAVVEVDATQHQIVIGPHIAERLSYARQDYCGLDRRLYLEGEPEAASVEGDALRMDVRLPAHGRTMLGEQLITNAFAQTPGWLVQVDDLPVTYPPDESTLVSVSWHIQDCRFAAENAVAPSIRFTTEGNVVVESWLGDRGAAMLARYVATQCTD